MLLSRSLLLPLAALALVTAASRPAAAQAAPSPDEPPPALSDPRADPRADPRLAPRADPRLAPPGQTSSCASCYAPPDYAAPPPGYAPVYLYAPPLRLTHDELQLLAEGEMSTAQHVAGSLLAISPGFGLGHLVQGRWLDKGWIFTVGEAASLALLVSSVESTAVCEADPVPPNGDDPYPVPPSRGCDRGLSADEWQLGVGIGLYVGLRIWEVVDAIATPAQNNRRVRALRSRIRQESGGVVVAPFLAPAREGGAMAGVAARF